MLQSRRGVHCTELHQCSFRLGCAGIADADHLATTHKHAQKDPSYRDVLVGDFVSLYCGLTAQPLIDIGSACIASLVRAAYSTQSSPVDTTCSSTYLRGPTCWCQFQWLTRDRCRCKNGNVDHRGDQRIYGERMPPYHATVSHKAGPWEEPTKAIVSYPR